MRGSANYIIKLFHTYCDVHLRNNKVYGSNPLLRKNTMQFYFINFLVIGLVISHTKLYAVHGKGTNSHVSRVVRAPSNGEQCECTRIVITSKGPAKKLHPLAMGEFKLSSSHFNAFKSTVYRKVKESTQSGALTLIGGQNQYWRIQGGSRAGRILLRNKSCKRTCPMDCSAGWELYKRPSYENDASISTKCEGEDGDIEGSSDGKESNN